MDQGIVLGITALRTHDRCSASSAALDLSPRTRPKRLACRSEIILSKLDLDNTSERTCVTLIVPLCVVFAFVLLLAVRC